MKVRFYESGGVDRVAIHSGFDGKDEVHRDATEEDRKRYAAEYVAFRPPRVVQVVDVVMSPAPYVVVPPSKPTKKQKE